MSAPSSPLGPTLTTARLTLRPPQVGDEAHLLALQRLWEGGNSAAYNLGNGHGFSVQEVIDTARQVTGREIPVQYSVRRPGDPARLVADARRARG